MNWPPTVIFDFDGTLVDSLGPGFKVCNAVAQEFGFKTITEEEIPRCRDMSTKELLKYVGVPRYKLPLVLKRLRREISREIPSIKTVSGIANCLKALQRAGVQLGIVTSNTRANVKRCLGANGVLGYFDFLYTSLNLFGKHRTLRRALKKTGLTNDQVIYIGDENRDIEAARKCAIRSVAVGWGFQSERKLVSAGPDFFAAHPMEIVTYVKRLA